MGIPAVNKRVPAKWKEEHRRLIELRGDLLSSQRNLSRDALEESTGFSSHVADVATDQFDRDFALGLLSSEQDAVYQIEEALGRIYNGTYGICEITGKPIERARLQAIPWTRFSKQAELELERQGVVRRRASLGPRETVAKGDETSEAEFEDNAETKAASTS